MRYDGEKIERARLEKGWSQTELAERVGVTSANISQIEAGTRKKPRCIEKIAEVLGLSMKKLVIDDEPARRSA